MKKWFVFIFVLLLCAGCGREETREEPEVKFQYSGRIICPRCRKKLQISLPEIPHKKVSCTKCKFSAPAPAFCPDLRRSRRK